MHVASNYLLLQSIDTSGANDCDCICYTGLANAVSVINTIILIAAISTFLLWQYDKCAFLRARFATLAAKLKRQEQQHNNDTGNPVKEMEMDRNEAYEPAYELN